MRAELLVLAALALAGCHSEDLNLGSGNVKDAGEEIEPGVLPTFDTPQEIEALSSDSDEPDDDPSLSEDGLVLCFNSKRDGGLGEEDIWCSDRTSVDESWKAPRPITELNSEDRETGIALSADGRKLWFSSDRPDGKGGLMSTRRVVKRAMHSGPHRCTLTT